MKHIAAIKPKGKGKNIILYQSEFILPTLTASPKKLYNYVNDFQILEDEKKRFNIVDSHIL